MLVARDSEDENRDSGDLITANGAKDLWCHPHEFVKETEAPICRILHIDDGQPYRMRKGRLLATRSRASRF